jgi:hypothetical protein
VGALIIGLLGFILVALSPTDKMISENNIVGPAFVIGLLLSPLGAILGVLFSGFMAMRKTDNSGSTADKKMRALLDSDSGHQFTKGFYRAGVLGFITVLILQMAGILYISLFGAMPGLSGHTPYWDVVRDLAFSGWPLYLGVALLIGALPFGAIGAIINTWVLPSWRKFRKQRDETS